MAHILDKLVGYDFGKPLRFQEFVDLLPRAEMIVADNVYQYFYSVPKYVEVDGSEKHIHVDLAQDFPTVAPPFPVFFVGANSLPKAADYQSGGCLFVAKDILDTQHESCMLMIDQYCNSSRAALKRDGVRWVLYCMPFAIHDWYLPPFFCHVLLLNEDGSYRIGMETWDYEGFDELSKVNGQSVDEIRESYSMLNALLLPPSLLTISLLHCRNVEVTEHLPNRKQSQKRERKRGTPLIKFRTLHIEPMKKVLREEGQVESNGLGVALHICRGHFKDYRDGKGLFGKHKDIYWWDMQSRGDAALGTVLKDYDAASLPDESLVP